MRWFISLVSMAALVAVAAQQPSSSGLLGPSVKEASAGWLALFDGDTTFGWRPVTGTVKAEGGVLFVGGPTETKVPLPIVGFGEGSWSYRYEGEKEPKLVLELSQAGQSPASATLPFNKASARGMNGWWQSKWAFEPDPTQTVNVEKTFKVDNGVNQETNVVRTSPQRLVAGHLIVPAGVMLELKDVRFRPTALQPIFNGKDLTGWKPVPDKKSVFSVTPEGWLNVQNGQGDLHTDGQWDDFVLQLDVISNGKHLNSGIFFRSLPGQFWSGYEAQIRNQWEGENRGKPVDMGTGGLYNRQAARRVNSTDNEWFTMTVLAHGNHLATWVNGYQVTDFVDTRPANKSGRSGTKLDKGSISIQGHDPGTNLSFKNIKLAELPRAEAAAK